MSTESPPAPAKRARTKPRPPLALAGPGPRASATTALGVRRRLTLRCARGSGLTRRLTGFAAWLAASALTIPAAVLDPFGLGLQRLHREAEPPALVAVAPAAASPENEPRTVSMISPRFRSMSTRSALAWATIHSSPGEVDQESSLGMRA